MELTLDKKHENKLTFLAEDVSVTFANALRRYSMVYVPVLAIDKVTFYENSSPLFDEYIAHRLGLVPITTPKRLAKDTEVSFRLDETGPKVVQTKELKGSDKDIKPGRQEIPIITLAEGQRIRLEGVAHLDNGTKHAKFQAGLVSYGIGDKNIQFLVESFYHMTPADVLIRGCDVLLHDIKELTKQLKKPKTKSKSKKTKPEKAKPEKTKTAKSKPDKTKAEKTKTEKKKK